MMMLSSVFTKTLWERRWGLVGWFAGGAATTAFMVAIYPVVRDSAALSDLLEQLPKELMSMVGMDSAIFTTGFGYLQAQMYTMMGPLLILMLAIGMGAGATALEEQTGTADLLLTTPTTRPMVVIQKTLAMVAAVTGLVLSFVTVLLIGQVTVELKLAILGIVGINLGVALLGMFFGTMAFAIAAWTGKRSLALGIAGGVAGLSFFLNGMAPLVEGLEGLQKFIPFHWYLADDPLVNGPTAWHLLLAGGSVLFAGLSVVGFAKRDIGVVSKLRLLPRRTERVAVIHSSKSRLLRTVAGTAVWNRRRSFWWWLLGMVSVAGLTMGFYPTLTGTGGAAFQSLIDAYPPEMLAMFGITDPSSILTGAGFLSTRVYSSIGLIVVLSFSIGMGRTALAGEEEAGTADLLVTMPLPRDRIVVSKAIAMFGLLVALLAGVGVFVWLGNAVVDLDLTVEGTVAANAGMAFLAFLFGSVALAVGAGTGRPGKATAVASAAGVVTFLLNGFGSVVDWLEPFRPLSPFYWYQGDTNPLDQSLGWQQPLLLAVGVVFVGVAVLLFRRREIGT